MIASIDVRWWIWEDKMRKVKQFLVVVCAVILTSCMVRASERRVAVPNPVLFMYGYGDNPKVDETAWGSADRYRALWEETLNTFTVIEGTTSDAGLVLRLRSQGKVFAYHVNYPIDGKQNTVEDVVAAWSKPFKDTLGGKLPGGFDAISIDEFSPYPDGSKEAQVPIQALRQLREEAPDRLIFVSGVPQMVASRPNLLSGDKQTTYDDTLNAIQKYGDVFLLENYILAGSPQFERFPALAKNVESRVPGLLRKTVYVLYIAQIGGDIYPANNDPAVDFFNFLELQIDLIKFGTLTKTMPGIAFWVFYRAKPATIEKVVNLIEEHYR